MTRLPPQSAGIPANLTPRFLLVSTAVFSRVDDKQITETLIKRFSVYGQEDPDVPKEDLDVNF